MNATRIFCTMLNAMVGTDEDKWREEIECEIDSLPEQVALPWDEGECTEATVEYVEDQLDREYWRMGKW